MGPKGRNVVVNKGGTFPLCTKDGITVAQEIEDTFENVGAQLVKQASSRASDTAGDDCNCSCVCYL
ncbi:MAG: hypothetical protein C5B45_00190 [Chlamydiae bacterium]|nr:MAG: hypothetical protein C5B45_00190 [Chlamydiota bacterium]